MILDRQTKRWIKRKYFWYSNIGRQQPCPASLMPKIRALVSNFPSNSNHLHGYYWACYYGKYFLFIHLDVSKEIVCKTKRENTFGIATKDGSSLALASLIPKIRASVSNFPSYRTCYYEKYFLFITISFV